MDLPTDLNYQLMLRMEDKDLVKFCQTSKKANEYCKNDIFWLNRILYTFPYIPFDVLKRYKGDRSWANYYIYDLRRLIKSENLVQFLLDASNGRLDHIMIFTNNGVRNLRALENAVMAGHLEIVKYLISKGYRPGGGSLIFAVTYGHLDVVKYLVENGADVNAEFLGGTPLGYAYEYGKTNIVKYLLEKGAKM